MAVASSVPSAALPARRHQGKRRLKEPQVAIDEGADGLASLAGNPLDDRVMVFPGEVEGVERMQALPVRRKRIECRLDALNCKGQLVDRLWSAGIRFRALWHAQVAQQRVTASFGASGGRAPVLEAAEAREYARQEVKRALAVLQGAGTAEGYAQADAVIGVAGQDETCAGRLKHLQDGLRRLADHWKVADDFCR
ncbi:hypothetical protein [Roseomonas sp. USHLN139]|uniref:hypothetical protein n=1 Tax=Roseomonas sp. USHLN139 TaxID=3081298 RepID=UPI003B025CA6